MKKVFTLLFLSIFTLSTVFAQLQFEFDADSLVYPPVVPTQFETILDNHVTNTSGGALELRWTRTVNEFKPTMGLGSAICIRDLCYPQSTSTNTFTLDRDEKAILSCHLWNLDNIVDPFAEVVVRVELVSDPTVFKDATFIFGEMTTSTNKVEASKTRFFPNPANTVFQLGSADWVETVKVMNILGKTVETFKAAPGQKYNIGHLPTGCYFAILHDDSGKAMRTIRFNKI